MLQVQSNYDVISWLAADVTTFDTLRHGDVTRTHQQQQNDGQHCGTVDHQLDRRRHVSSDRKTQNSQRSSRTERILFQASGFGQLWNVSEVEEPGTHSRSAGECRVNFFDYFHIINSTKCHIICVHLCTFEIILSKVKVELLLCLLGPHMLYFYRVKLEPKSSLVLFLLMFLFWFLRCSYSKYLEAVRRGSRKSIRCSCRLLILFKVENFASLCKITCNYMTRLSTVFE